MLEAAFWGLVAASALVIGAAVGIWVPISRRIVALIMAFGAGALVSALAFDLTEEAFAQGGTGPTALGLAQVARRPQSLREVRREDGREERDGDAEPADQRGAEDDRFRQAIEEGAEHDRRSIVRGSA